MLCNMDRRHTCPSCWHRKGSWLGQSSSQVWCESTGPSLSWLPQQSCQPGMGLGGHSPHTSLILWLAFCCSFFLLVIRAHLLMSCPREHPCTSAVTACKHPSVAHARVDKRGRAGAPAHAEAARTQHTTRGSRMPVCPPTQTAC